MLRTKLIASALTVCGLALATGCHDDDCEVRNTRVYYEQPCPPPPPPVVYQSAPVIYQSPPVVYRPRPVVRVRNRYVDVRVDRPGNYHRDVNVHVRRNWD